MKVILHVGPHKTGTSYLQKTFLENFKILQQHGIFYPKGIIPENLFGQHILARALRKGREAEVNGLISTIVKKNYNKILLSSESFSQLNINSLQLFKQSINSFEQISIIYSVRSPVTLLPSRWQENIKQGQFFSFEEFLIKHIALNQSSDLLNQVRILKKFENVFGINNIKLLNYDYHISYNKDLADFFFNKILQIEDYVELENKKINKSLSWENIEILRGLNYIHHSKYHELSKDIRRNFFKYNNQKGWEVESKVVSILNKYKNKLKLNLTSNLFKNNHQRLLQTYSGCFLYNQKAVENYIIEKEIDYTANFIFTDNLYSDYLTNLYNKINQ